jgi:lipoprotein-releasing system permease protein
VLVSANITTIVHGIEQAMGIAFVDPRVYFISELPAEIRMRDVLLIGGTSLVLCMVATIYPAWRAAVTLPAEALRHEV